jgi:16S rRNA (cytosine967-C5)-methyltransferase
VKFGKERGAAGMVNAVLRKMQGPHDRAPDSRFRAPGPKRSLAAELAARWAHPDWMVERWVRRYGVEAAEAICRWDQEPAGVALRVGVGPGDLEGIETEPGAFLAAARRVVRGDVGRSDAFREGHVRIQDEGSQLVAEVVAAASSGAERVLDACAAPGGKTLVLAERLPQAEITAVDVSRGRLDAMRTRMPEAIVERVRFEVADVTRMDLKPEWDLILCDVPCSGTGTMARNPEIRLRVTEDDLARQHRRQVAILRAGLRGLKAGGRLVYSTCSLEPEENEQVVSEVLRSAAEFRVVPMEGILDRLAERGVVTVEGRERLRTAAKADFLRTLPGLHPCDGFFAAVLSRD